MFRGKSIEKWCGVVCAVSLESRLRPRFSWQHAGGAGQSRGGSVGRTGGIAMVYGVLHSHSINKKQNICMLGECSGVADSWRD